MAKKNPLGENPLNPDAIVRDMVRGRTTRTKGTKGKRDASQAAARVATSTVTAGGLLRKTVYFTEAEWQAIRALAFKADRNYTDIIREAVRRFLDSTKAA